LSCLHAYATSAGEGQTYAEVVDTAATSAVSTTMTFIRWIEDQRDKLMCLLWCSVGLAEKNKARGGEGKGERKRGALLDGDGLDFN